MPVVNTSSPKRVPRAPKAAPSTTVPSSRTRRADIPGTRRPFRPLFFNLCRRRAVASLETALAAHGSGQRAGRGLVEGPERRVRPAGVRVEPARAVRARLQHGDAVGLGRVARVALVAPEDRAGKLDGPLGGAGAQRERAWLG